MDPINYIAIVRWNAESRRPTSRRHVEMSLSRVGTDRNVFIRVQKKKKKKNKKLENGRILAKERCVHIRVPVWCGFVSY